MTTVVGSGGGRNRGRMIVCQIECLYSDLPYCLILLSKNQRGQTTDLQQLAGN